MRPHLIVAFSVLVTGCAAGTEEDEGDPAALRAPVLDSMAPGAVSLGDEIKLIGRDFPDKRVATTSLRLNGVYTEEGGQQRAFDGEFPVEVENPSVASIVMDDLYFSPGRDKIGTFAGTATLTVATADREGIESEPVDVSLRILPSIRVERLRAVDAGCNEITRSTIANTPIELRFAALGVGDATPDRPWNVKVSFLAPQLQARYIIPGAYDFWPINGPIDDSITATAPDGVSSLSFKLENGRSISFDPAHIEHRVRVNPPISIGQQLHEEVVVQRFATGPVAFLGLQYANMVVEVDAGDSRVLRREVAMEVWNELEIELWDGEEKLLRRFEPEATSGCLPGGALGVDLTYTEGESVSRTRSVGFRWDANASSSLGFNVGPSIAAQINGSQNWSETFGVDVNESVTSEAHTSQNINVHVIPGYYGMSYRQLEQLEREADIVYHNVCGSGGVVGQATLTNWNFGFDVATGPDCPPPSNLPPAETFE